jgi:hypothetical protein
VVAFALLIGASRQWTTISAYHFTVAAYLAALSLYKHIVMLISLGSWTAKSRFLTYFRLFTFSAVLGIVVWAWTVKRDYSGSLSPRVACPAYCCYSQGSIGDQGLYHLVYHGAYVLVMVVAVLLKILYTTNPEGIVRFLASGTGGTAWKRTSVVVVWFSKMVQLLMIAEFPVLARLVCQKWDGTYFSYVAVTEDFDEQVEWEIGQLVPMILLALPFIAAVQGFIGELQSPFLRRDLITE